MSESKTAGGGVGVTGLLLVLFVGLKLTGHINWEWYWVLSPIWIPLLLIFGVFVILLLVALFTKN